MAKDVIALASVSKEDVPANLKAEAYFDFKTYPFEHQALIEEANSVYAAILGIDKYAKAWLADTIAAKRSSAKACKNETPTPAHTVGEFEVLVEDGAVFEPARVIGSTSGECHTICVAKGA